MSQTALKRFLCPAVVIAATQLLASCNGAEQPAAPAPSPPAGGDTSSVSAPQSAAPDSAEAFAWPETPAELPEGAPLISFAKMRHEYGAITDAGKYIGSFPFKNIGKGTLIIRDIRTVRGCTVPELEKREYLPGEEGTLDVVFDPSNRKGGFIKYLFMLSNSVAMGQAKLSVSADITPLVRFDSVFLRVGHLELGKEHERLFSMYYTDPDLEFPKFSADNPHVTVRLLKRSRLPQPGPDGRDEYRAVIGITIARTAPWGTLLPGEIRCTARQGPRPGDEPREANYTLFLSSQLYGDLRAEPAALSSGTTVRVGESFDASMVLSSASGTYFSVIDASLAEPSDLDVEVQVEPIDPASYRISIHYIPSIKGPINGSVRVLTDVPGEEDLTIWFTGYVK
ncbi:MAG: DUF1573 domain-containing protein [Planctomycetota bacterium]